MRPSQHRARPAPQLDAHVLQALPPEVRRSWQGGWRSLSRAEWGLLAACALALLLAVLLPATALPAGYHDFADHRALGGMPNALDVLSNAPFLAMAIWLWRLQARWLQHIEGGELARESGLLSSMQSLSLVNGRQAAHTAYLHLGVIALGLAATSLCSGVYHWQPDDAHLCIDRLGMSLAFAGVLGLAVSDRLSARAGLQLDLPLLVAAVAAAVWAWRMGNMTPWATVQGFGLVLLLAMAVRRPLPGALGVRWAWVVLAYGVAKALEVNDQAVFDWSGGLIAGHSLKHVVAALAVLPIGLAVRRQLRQA